VKVQSVSCSIEMGWNRSDMVILARQGRA